LFDRFPRALPWAMLSQPFRLKSQNPTFHSTPKGHRNLLIGYRLYRNSLLFRMAHNTSSTAVRRSTSLNASSNFIRSASSGRLLSAARNNSSTIASGFFSESASLRAVPVRERTFAAISGEFIKCKAWAMRDRVQQHFRRHRIHRGVRKVLLVGRVLFS
jgi:hypothetical protein